MMSTAIPEEDVLTPRDSSTDDDSDNWPEFELSNATVHLPHDCSTTASLLDAAQHYPLTITGQLQPVEKGLAHLYCGPALKKRVNVEVKDVRFFSYGQMEDGTVCIWAPGRAGWFLIRPSRTYKSVYVEMIDAIRTFYFIADAHKERRKTGKGPRGGKTSDCTFQEVFAMYATDVMAEGSAPADAAQHIYRHVDALFSFMLLGKEDIVWTRTSIYRHLIQKFPALHTKIKQRINGSSARSAKSNEQTTPRSPEEASSTTSSVRPRRGRPPKIRSVSGETGPDETGPGEVRTGTERSSPRRATQPVYTPAKDSDSESEVLRSKGKSVLRLRGSKASKGTSRSGNNATNGLDIEDRDTEPAEQSSPIGSKRRLQDISDNRPVSKRRTSQSQYDEGIGMPSSPEDSADSVSGLPSEENQDDASLSASSAHDLTNQHHHVPDEPASTDIWACALDGCRYKIYGASKTDSQKLIREHYELHAFDDDARVQLVKRLQEPSLPTGHLMERVKMQAKMEGDGKIGLPQSRLAVSRYPTKSRPSTFMTRIAQR